MQEPLYLNAYRLAPGGRVGYFVMLVAGVVMAAMTWPPRGWGMAPWHMRLMATAIFLASAGLAAVCWFRMFGPSVRLQTYEFGFVYQGLFRQARVRWDEIVEWRLNLRSTAFVTLDVVLAPGNRVGKRSIRLDVSGLRPSYETIAEEFRQHVPAAQRGTVV